jgi:hypothetical protein
MMLRLPQQMLARAEAHFEPEVFELCAEPVLRLQIERKLRQQRLKQLRLMRAELRAFAPSVEQTAMTLRMIRQNALFN